MARRDWSDLQDEFTKFEREGGNLTRFCELKGLSRSSAGRNLKTLKQLEKSKKPKSFKKHIEEVERRQPDDDQPIEHHMTADKIEFYSERNGANRNHANFLMEFFRRDSVREAAEALNIPLSTAYSYLRNEAVQKTIDDVTSTAFEVETTTPARIRGRMCAIANANMKDYFNEAGKFKTPEQWTRTEGMAVKEIKIKPTEFGIEYTLKLYDAMNALETLGKVNGLFDKVEENKELQEYTDEEIEALINEQEQLLSRIADTTNS